MGCGGEAPALMRSEAPVSLFFGTFLFSLHCAASKRKEMYGKNKKVKISYAAFLCPQRNAAQRNSPRRISVRYLLVIAHFLKFLTRANALKHEKRLAGRVRSVFAFVQST